MRSLRAPVEPARLIEAIEPGSRSRFDPAKSWAMLVRRRARSSGLLVPDQVFGLAWSGAFDTTRLRGLLARLPEGLSEIYLHPSSDDHYPGHAAGYRYRDELAALIDLEVRALAGSAMSGRFADFARQPG